MRHVAVGVLLCALSGCYPDRGDARTVSTVRGLIVGDSLVVYVSPFAIDEPTRAVIDEGGQVGFDWVRIEVPLEPADLEIDLSAAGEGEFAQEYASSDPWTGEPATYRLDFVPGEEGLSGYIARAAGETEDDDVGAVRVTYHVMFQGFRRFLDETPRRLDFDSSNDATLVPEGPQN